MGRYRRILLALCSIVWLAAAEPVRLPDLVKDPNYQRPYHFSADSFTRLIPGWTQHLAAFKDKSGIRYLETGASEGRSALWMLENILTDPSSRLTCIDDGPSASEETLRENLRIADAAERTTLIRGPSRIALQTLPESSFDIIHLHVDGSPADVLTDAVQSWPLLKVGGVLILDDYLSGDPNRAPRTQTAIDGFTATLQQRLEVLERGEQLIVTKTAFSGSFETAPPYPPPNPVRDENYRKAYRFSVDWYTRLIPRWNKHLAPFKGKPGVHYLEIGVYEGRSAFWVLENVLTDPTSRMTCIDDFRFGSEATFRENLRISRGEKQITAIKGSSQVALKSLTAESFDIIYIDGSHDPADILTDAILSWPLLKVGGTLIFDDYLFGDPNWTPRAQTAIDAFTSTLQPLLTILELNDQLILTKRMP